MPCEFFFNSSSFLKIHKNYLCEGYSWLLKDQNIDIKQFFNIQAHKLKWLRFIRSENWNLDNILKEYLKTYF